MSERARKAGQFAGAVERLAVELAMVEIIQARQPRHSEPPYTFGNRWR